MRTMLWRLRRDKLASFKRIEGWGMEAPKRCVLCGEEEEMMDRLFFRCRFSKGVWKKVEHAMGYPTGRVADMIVDIGDKADDDLTQGAPLWGFIWSGLAAAIWHLWRERNHQWKRSRH